MQITSGEITYSRTVNLGDYNSKKVEVKLAFTIADGEDAATAADNAGSLAWEKCGDLLTMSAKPQRLETPVAAAIPQVEPSAPAKRGPGRPPKVEAVKAPEPAKIEAKAEPVKVEEPVKELTVEPVGDDFDFLSEEAEPAKVISDEELVSHATRRNGELNSQAGPAIKRLMADYGVPAGARIVGMPQAKRAAFLVALASLKI